LGEKKERGKRPLFFRHFAIPRKEEDKERTSEKERGGRGEQRGEKRRNENVAQKKKERRENVKKEKKTLFNSPFRP